jgi:solute carrier family 10 (sodium/bile acid cotransporter), member 7
MVPFLTRHWFLIALALLLALGFAFPAALRTVSDEMPERAIVAVVLLLMSVTLDASTMWRAMRRPGAVLLAVVINAGLLPLAAWPVAGWLSPPELSIGLLVAASVPSTLASAAVWTRRAGGNDAIALLVTMITNMACFIVAPFWVHVTTGEQAKLKDAPVDMAIKLALICVLPILAGQVMRFWRPVGEWAKRRKVGISVVAQSGILAIVLAGAIKAGNELRELPADSRIGWFNWAAMLSAVIALHLSALWTGHALGRLCGLPREDRIAVGFSGSQKTLMIGLSIAGGINGLAILPMIAFHVCQLLADTLIAERLLRRGEPRERSK